MSKFRNLSTGVVVSVSDEKDIRFVDGWESADVKAPVSAPVKRSGK